MAKLSAKYEILYIIDPAQGEEGIAALVEKFKGLAEGYGEVTPEMPAELDRVFKITDGILRSIIVAVEE